MKMIVYIVINQKKESKGNPLTIFPLAENYKKRANGYYQLLPEELK